MHPFLALVLICASTAVAQTPLHRLTSVFSGRWTISGRSEPSPGNPNGVVTTGEEVWHALAGGTPLVEEFHSKTSAGVDGYDTAAFWWDSTSREYRGLFCGDFVDQGCSQFDIEFPVDEGQKKSNLITMKGEYLQNGKTYLWRETFEFQSDARFTQRLFVAERGSDLKLVATMTAVRTAP